MLTVTDWGTILVACIIVVITPGPNFAITVRNSLVYSRATGLLTVIGIVLGSVIHISYCLMGIGLIISQSILLFNLLKWLGAAYLVYMGIKALRAQPRPPVSADTLPHRRMSGWRAVSIGLLTTLLNPKATLFFLALFTQMIEPGTPLATQLFYGGTMIALEFVWYAMIVCIISQIAVKRWFESAAHWIERVTGALLILFGIRLALSRSAQ